MSLKPSAASGAALAERIVDRIEEILREAEETTRPLEVDPSRKRLFELFVTVEGAGYLEEGSSWDLTADGLCRILAERWGLRDATAAWLQQQSRLPQQQLAKMRLLWSLMRMWMEWTYAWQRWPEFHDDGEDR